MCCLQHQRDDIEQEDPIESFVKHRNKMIEEEQKREKPNEELEYLFSLLIPSSTHVNYLFIRCNDVPYSYTTFNIFEHY